MAVKDGGDRQDKGTSGQLAVGTSNRLVEPERVAGWFVD